MKEKKCKLAMIVSSNLINAPYYIKYKKLLNNIDIDYIVWNRSLEKNSKEQNVISYNVKDRIASGNPLKIYKYLGFAEFVKKTIKKNKYDGIILFSAGAMTEVLLRNFFIKNYKGYYWLDIRDYAHERIPYVYSSMRHLIHNSFYTVVSSRHYQSFLPDYSYGIIHNIDNDNIVKAIELRRGKDKKRCGDKLIISFIGLFEFWASQKKVIDIFANDKRYELHFHGTNTDLAKNYCLNNRIYNVLVTGEFPKEKTAEFYKDTDIINNVYGNDDIGVRTALSNKLYYSLGLEIPILVSPNTQMEQVTRKAGNGFTIDFSKEDIADKLYNWYFNEFENQGNKCKEYYTKFDNENKKFENKFLDFCLKCYEDKK